MAPGTNDPTPSDAAATRAVGKARHIAMMQLEGYRVISEAAFKILVIGAVLSTCLNVGLWVYILIKLPP